MIALDCYDSLSSPWAYLGGPQLQDSVRRPTRILGGERLRGQDRPAFLDRALDRRSR